MRLIGAIAREITKDWKNVNFAAKPYLLAMFSLTGKDDQYGMDSAEDIILRFLVNAGTWKGEEARRIKKELKEIIGAK